MQPNPENTSDETWVFNGIDGATGSYLLPEMTPAQVSSLAQGGTLDPAAINELKQRSFDLQNPHAGVEADARDLAATGWGVVFAYDADPALLEALSPLLSLRQEQAGERFKVFAGADGYRPGESKNEFLERHGMGPGPANPDKVPYYLLIVGDPVLIPYRFQYQLDVQYAVGRIHFDQVEDYARYAQSVRQAESGFRLAPRAAFFGVGNSDDRATTMSAEYLVKPLADKVAAEKAQWLAQSKISDFPDWQVETILKEEATKARLASLLGGDQAPALLFSASHGIGFPNGDARQIPHQGALICQDWPGPQLWHEPIPQDFYFAGEDLSQSENMLGTIAFFFACYGAGTPQLDEFAPQLWRDQPERINIAPHDFVASLPRRMLSLPKGGALAVVGHVERAWGVSFYWGKAGAQTQVFEDCFERLMKGNYPIGYALEVFNNRYAELSSDLSSELVEIKQFFKKPDDRKLAQMWTANNDARNYVIIGDPAVRLAVGSPAAPRPELGEIVISSAASKSAVSPAVVGRGDSPTALEQGAPPVNYSLPEESKQAQPSVQDAVHLYINRLMDILDKSLKADEPLEVSTYASQDLEGVRYAAERISGATLCILTRIDINGDTQVVLPEEGSELDPALRSFHMEMVRQAQASRLELLKTLVSAASGLIDLMKPAG
jgi:Peptidase family C25